MPSATPTKSFLTEGGAECEKVRVIHSNELQERKSYTYEKKRPDEGNPLKFYLLNFGNSVQPGDPVGVRITKSGDKKVFVVEDNRDVKSTGFPGRAWIEAIPPETWISTRGGSLIWPCEFVIVDAESIGYSDPGVVLRVRSQRSSYKPGLTDAEIELEPAFLNRYNQWLSRRYWDLYDWDNDIPPPPPAEYESAGEKGRIRPIVRADVERQWSDWDDFAVGYKYEESGSYWTGTDPAVYQDYSFSWAVNLEAAFVRPDGTTIGGEGLDPVTLLAYEFVSERGLDISNINDWTEALRINFMGTPAPLTIECDDSNCPNHCLEISRESDKAWMCICSTDDLEPTPIAETPNRINRKPSPGSPDPPPLNLGQRKAKARDYQRKLQPKFDKAKSKYKELGDVGETAHNLHREKDAIAKDPTRSQSARDAAAAEAAQALLDRNDAMHGANKAAEEMLDARRGLDALKDFLKDDPDNDSGISVGTALPPKPGWRPPLVQGGNGWNNTPSYTNNNAANPDRGTTQVFGPSGGIQAAQVQDPTIVGGGGFQDTGIQSPQVVGGGGFVPGQWNATPTAIIETPEEIVEQIITSED